MSTLNPSATTTRRPAVNVPAPAAPALETVTIRWSLSRQALRMAKPAAPFVPTLAGLSEVGADLELRWRVNLDDSRAIATLVDLPVGVESPVAHAACRHTVDGDLLHVECADGPVGLAATVRIGDGDARVLYAMTTLISMLGLGGGRYEVA